MIFREAMALIDCPECAGRVSDRAAACPHCGFPVREEHLGGAGPEEELLAVSPRLFGGTWFMHALMVLLCVVVVGSDVRNVRVTQGFVDRLFSVGTIELSSAGQSDVEISVKGMPDPQGIAEIIRRYR